MAQSWYDTAQVCLNGHITNGAIQLNPDGAQTFCAKCGETTITACTGCEAPIQGDFISRGYFDGAKVIGNAMLFTRPVEASPGFCVNCGKPFPWTEAALDAARELADLELTETDAAVVKENLTAVIADTPRTKVAAMKVKKAIEKASPTVAGLFRDIFVQVASETAKKVLLGP